MSNSVSAPAASPASWRESRELLSAARMRAIALNRVITIAVVLASFATLLWLPLTMFSYALDVVLRTYLMFIAMVMAHEAAHGHLARTRRANDVWGRFALLPVMVTFGKFRRTHLLHHKHTNDPQRDPDYWLVTDREWEIPFRALTMPHQWAIWLVRHGKFSRRDALTEALNWLTAVVVYAAVVYAVGWQRALPGVGLPMVLVSLVLWFFFAIRTHEGHSRGAPETRSHNYYGAALYWLTCGLSLHRVHHLNPALPWLHMRRDVPRAPGPWWRRIIPLRDVRRDML
jgi:fatty acid desaturase